MCGIAGFVGSGDEKVLSEMIGAIAYRGPDDKGVFFDKEKRVGLAHARLSVIDLSEKGHQPMWNKKHTAAIVFNGEIYNFKELRKECSEYDFVTGTDTEVILALYEKYEEQCFSKLDGMFAIALYDAKERRLLLARDRMGEKPLYFSVRDGMLFFASELKALNKHPLANTRLNQEALARYLCREYVPMQYTIYEDVFKLEPATYLVFQDSKYSKHSFSKPVDETFSGSFTEGVSKLDDLLEKTVRERLVADVPVGVFLSGGLDSSTVAYYAQKATGGKVKTFSIGFDEKSYDESKHAQSVARHLGTEHFHKVVTAKDALDLVDRLPYMLDEPMADASIIPTYMLSCFAREHVTVALGGDGADELFAGYPTFQAEKLVSYYQNIPSFLLDKIIKPSIRVLPASDSYFGTAFKLQKFVEGVDYPAFERHARWLGAFNKEELEQLLNPDVYELVKNTDVYQTQFGPLLEHTNNNILREYQNTYLLDDVLTKVDRASMQKALEVRSPFLGKEVVEFANSLPYEWKLKGWTTKYILKELMKDKLPEQIVNRKKKGFAVPVAVWFKKELRPLLLDYLDTETVKSEGIFNSFYTDKLVNEHLDGKRNHAKRLWTLLMFQMWQRKYLG